MSKLRDIAVPVSGLKLIYVRPIRLHLPLSPDRPYSDIERAEGYIFDEVKGCIPEKPFGK